MYVIVNCKGTIMEWILSLWHLCFPPVNHQYQCRPEANVFIPFQFFLISLDLHNGVVLQSWEELGSPWIGTTPDRILPVWTFKNAYRKSDAKNSNYIFLSDVCYLRD
jgi:hypothetical protein